MSSDTSVSSRVFDPRLRIIRQLIEGYDGSLPLHRYLKNHFRANRHFGSRDRKIYSDWIFSWFRIGKALADLDFEERITVSRYLTGGLNHPMIFEAVQKYLNKSVSDWNDESDVNERIKIISGNYPSFSVQHLFPFAAKLSNDASNNSFYLSHIHQPLVWIRLFPGAADEIITYCTDNNVAFETHHAIASAIGFPPAFNVEQLPFRKGIHYEVQDLASQICGASVPAKEGEHWWDCCCGAGGKSLQLLHRIPGVRIYATDIRASVLENFKERIPKQFKKQVTFNITDLTSASVNQNQVLFDGILADVPCSGSGTWSRNPENISYFDERLLPSFRTSQEHIVTESTRQLKSGGTLVYMTCSVFEIENEGMVAFILQNLNLTLVRSELVKGFENNSDSMFYAIFKKP